MSTPTIDTDRLIWSFNMLMDVKATAEETGGALSVIDSGSRRPPTRRCTCTTPPTRLSSCSRARWSSSWRRRPAPGRAGDFVFGPRGVPHRFEVRTPEARILVLGTPGGGDQFFRALGEPAATATLPVPQAPDVERVVAVAAAHDIEILAPPAS